MIKNMMMNIVLSSFIFQALPMFWKPVNTFIFLCDVVCRVSLNRNMSKTMLMKVMSAVKKNGVEKLNHEMSDGSESLPPIYGPRIKPSPNAMPMSPKLRAFSSLVLMSAIADCATEMLPPVKPSIIRLRNNK